jgi:hypothetical protein
MLTSTVLGCIAHARSHTTEREEGVEREREGERERGRGREGEGEREGGRERERERCKQALLGESRTPTRDAPPSHAAAAVRRDGDAWPVKSSACLRAWRSVSVTPGSPASTSQLRVERLHTL